MAFVTGPAVMLATGFGDTAQVTAAARSYIARPAAYAPAPRAYQDTISLERAVRQEATAAAAYRPPARVAYRPAVLVRHATRAVTPWTPGAGGALGACIRQREEGGSYAWGPGNGGGAYQFEPATWATFAPPGAVRGQASPGQQDQAFLNALHAGDASAWNADGCPQAFGLAARITNINSPATGVELLTYMSDRAPVELAGAVSPFALPASVASLPRIRLNVPTEAQAKSDLAWLAAQAKAATQAKARAAAALKAAGVPAAAQAAGGSLTMRAMDWALAQQGKPYIWGATGPYGFDCSGLIYAAYQAMGVSIPRDTYEMLASSVLVPISSPVRGALAFYGTGHVELWWAPGVTFGAQQPGTAVGFHSYGGGWAPTAYYLIR